MRPSLRWLLPAISLGITPLAAQESAECAIYHAVIAAIAPDSTRPMVVYDSTSLGTPTFAFHAWTSMGRPKDTLFAMTSATWDSVRADLQPRGPLPACLAGPRKMMRLRYDSISTKFTDRMKGWDVFRAAYPEAGGFFMFGKVFYPVPGGDRALLYAAHASDWLAGGGFVYFLRKIDGVWRVEGKQTMWLS